MKLTLQTVFYFLSIVALVLFIIYLLDTIMDDDDENSHTPVVMIPFVQQYRPYWRRFRNNLPWVGPRPGGRGYYGNRYLRRHRRRNRRLRP